MAHVGVWKYLQEKDYRIKAVSGTSAGAIIGAFIADGWKPADVEALILEHIHKLPVNHHHLKQGLLNVQFLKDLLQSNLRSKNIEDLRVPFYANATNYETGVGVTFSSGCILDAVIASASIPIVFPPVIIKGLPYVDGGLSCNLNVRPLKQYTEPVVGVFVNPLSSYDPLRPLKAQSDRVVHLVLREMMLGNIALCDVYIEPAALKEYTVFDVKDLAAIAEIGYEAARQKLTQPG